MEQIRTDLSLEKIKKIPNKMEFLPCEELESTEYYYSEQIKMLVI